MSWNKKYWAAITPSEPILQKSSFSIILEVACWKWVLMSGYMWQIEHMFFVYTPSSKPSKMKRKAKIKLQE